MQAQEHLQHALLLYKPERDNALALTYGQDPGVAALSYLALTHWPLGNVTRAIAYSHEAVAHSNASCHVNTIAYAIFHRLLFDTMRRCDDFALANADALLNIVEKL